MEDVRGADAALAAVGTGDVAYARHFAEERDIRFPLLVDDERRSYKAVGTKRGRMIDLAKPAIVRAGAAALARGHLQGRTGPAPMVLGAAHVIRPDGTVPFAWINDDVSDNAPLAEVVAALEAS